MMPMLLLFVLNAVNFGYFFFLVTNLAAAPRDRSGVFHHGRRDPSRDRIAR